MKKTKIIYYTADDITSFWKTVKIGNSSIMQLHRKEILKIRNCLYSNTEYWGENKDKNSDVKFGVVDTNLMWYDGIFDIHCDTYWSNINFWDNNQSFFAENLNIHNKKYSNNQIDFKNAKTNEDFKREWDKYVEYLKKDFKDIFPNPKNFNVIFDNDSTVAKLMECPHISRRIGDSSVGLVVNVLEKCPDVTDLKLYNNGSKKDHEGIDGNFKLSGIEKTIQIKTFKSINFSFKDNKFIIYVDSGQYHHIDFIGLSNQKDVYIFKNGLNYNLQEGRYTFPQDSLWLTNKNPF